MFTATIINTIAYLGPWFAGFAAFFIILNLFGAFEHNASGRKLTIALTVAIATALLAALVLQPWAKRRTSPLSPSEYQQWLNSPEGKKGKQDIQSTLGNPFDQSIV